MQAISESGSRPSASCNPPLLARLVADHGLEVAYHHRIKMRPCDGADAIERVVHIGDQSRSASFIASFSVREPDCTGPNRAQHFHPDHVRLLPLDVDRAHIDDAFEPEPRAQHRGGDAGAARCRR